MKNGVVTPPSLTYDKGTSKTEAETKGTSLHTTLSDSAHLTSTKLFGYLPLPFGLNLTNAQSYSENEVKTGTLTKTPSLVISATMGSVDDAEYSYSVTTHVYFHKTLGCLTVAYSVALIGSGWARDYSLAKPMLIRPLRKRTDNVVLSAFSRAIRPFEQSGKVFIEVEIFNCSLRTATKVECTCYSGMPVKAPAVATLAGDSVTVPDDSKMIGKKTVEIGPTQRNTVTFEWTGAKEGDCVTAGIKRLSPPALGDALSDIGWNVYPERLYEKWNDDWGS
jgi:hypothetical protein